MSTKPYLSKNFFIEWSSLSPEAALSDIREAIAQAQAALAAIAAQDLSQLSYESTFAAFEQAPMPLGRAWGLLNHLSSVNDSPEIRAVMMELLPEVSTFSATITLNPQLFAVLNAAASADWVAGLSPVKQRFIAETIADFNESGAALCDADKGRYVELSTRLAELSQQFGEHVLDSTKAWEYITTDVAELAGLPDDLKESFRLDALSKGHGSEGLPAYRLSLQAICLIPVLSNADSAALRERLWRGNQSKGVGKYDTAALIEEILSLRAQLASLMGYGCYSDYVLSRRMAGTGNRALGFINSLHDKVRSAFLKEQGDIKLFAERCLNEEILFMEPWSIAYWAERRRKELFSFDKEQLRPYFSMETVLDGMYELYSELYGIRIKQVPSAYRELGSGDSLPEGCVEVWHPEVSYYELYDTGSGEHLGSFYTDWYPRESKRAGAWMNCLICGMPSIGSAAREPHLGLMCGNMSKPVGDRPALLSHDDVETIFHEFGHLLHQLLSEVEVKSLAGCNVAWDFVELPSQINENWTWQKAALQRLAKHWQTGEALPDVLLERMLAAKNDGAASFAMRQLSLGKLDLELHVHTAQYLEGGLAEHLEQIDREILSDYRIPVTEIGNSVLRSFSHIFDGGYESGYYSYKWAEMLEADAFSRFEVEGIFNSETGRDFRRCILSKGNSKLASELYRDFMHRDPDADAMLRRDGTLC